MQSLGFATTAAALLLYATPASALATSASIRTAPRLGHARMVASVPVAAPSSEDAVEPLLSGLQGKALLVEAEDVPQDFMLTWDSG